MNKHNNIKVSRDANRLVACIIVLTLQFLVMSNAMATIYLCVRDGSYYINGRIAGEIKKGKIFQADVNPKDHRWVDVKSSRGTISISKELVETAGVLLERAEQAANSSKRKISEYEESIEEAKIELRAVKSKLRDARATVKRDTGSRMRDSDGYEAAGRSVTETYYSDEYIRELEVEVRTLESKINQLSYSLNTCNNAVEYFNNLMSKVDAYMRANIKPER